MERIGKKSLWSRYLALWQSLSGWRLLLFYALHYTALFAVMWPILFSAFAENGKSFIWTTDAMPLWCTDLTYISKTFREAIQSLLNGEGWTFPLYDFTREMIERDLRLEPIQLLAVLWPWDRIDKLYDILVVARFYLAGLSFSVFGFYFKQKPMPVLIGAVSYVFCQYALYAGIRHPFFMQAMIYLPLLLVAIEKTMRGGKPFMLIGIVFLVLISNVYWACIQAALAGFYVLVRILVQYKDNKLRGSLRIIGRLAVGVGIGFLLSGILFAAPLLQNLRIERIGNGDVLQYTGRLSYAKEYYSKFISYFTVDGAGSGSWVHLGFSVLAVPSIALLFVNGKKEHRMLRAMFIVMTAMLMVPVVAYVMSGFNAVSNRWCLAYAFCVSAIIMFELPLLAEADKKTLIYAGLIVAAYCFVCRFVIIEKYYRDYVIAFLVIAAVVIALCCCLDARRRKILMPICLVITCFSVNYTAHHLFDADKIDYVSEFLDKGKFYETIGKSPYASFGHSDVMEEDGSFYRVAHDLFNRSQSNVSSYYGVNGTDAYNQWWYHSYDDWIREMELAHFDVFGVYHGVDQRAAMQALDGIKYFVQRQTDNGIAQYGYEPIEEVENISGATDSILENQYALPVGYTYDSYISRSEYEALSAPEKQEAQLQTAVLDSTPKSAAIKQADLEITVRQVPAEISEMDNVTWKDGKLKVKEGGGTVTLTFDGMPNAETYLRIVNFDLTSGASTRSMRVDATAGAGSAKGKFYADAYIYRNGMKTQILNLGYSEEGYTTCTVNFPTKGTYKLEDLQIWCQPMDNFAGQIEALRAEPLKNVETNWRGLTGTISLSGDKILCVSVPYAEGWTAYVDGEKADILQVNTAFMGLELEAGEHTIEFRYWTPGLTAGIVMSAAGLAALAWIILRWRKRPLWAPEENKLEKRGRA